MEVMELMYSLATMLQQQRFSTAQEKLTQMEVERFLTSEGIRFEREKHLSDRDIPDFLIQTPFGNVVLEVKTRYPPREPGVAGGGQVMDRDAEKDLTMCEAATPGPWKVEPNSDDEEGLTIWREVEDHPGRLEGVIVLHPECHYEKADVDLITEAREALPYWIKRALVAEAEAEFLRGELSRRQWKL